MRRKILFSDVKKFFYRLNNKTGIDRVSREARPVFLLWIRHAPGAHPHDSQKTLSYIIQQFRCWGLLHFDVSEEFLACIFEAGPEEIYHIVDNLHVGVEDLTIEEDAFYWGQGRADEEIYFTFQVFNLCVLLCYMLIKLNLAFYSSVAFPSN